MTDHDGGELTKYGFRWGPVEVIRAHADERGHMLLIYTDRREVQIAITPTGLVRLHESKRLAVRRSVTLEKS